MEAGGGLKNLTATPAEVKQGYTFSRDGKTVESGTMNLTNLVPGNVRAGVNIAGVVGAHDGELGYSDGKVKKLLIPNKTIPANTVKEAYICDVPPRTVGIKFESSNINIQLNSAHLNDINVGTMFIIVKDSAGKKTQMFLYPVKQGYGIVRPIYISLTHRGESFFVGGDQSNFETVVEEGFNYKSPMKLYIASANNPRIPFEIRVIQKPNSNPTYDYRNYVHFITI